MKADPRLTLILRSIEELSDLPLTVSSAGEFYETLLQIFMGALGVSRGALVIRYHRKAGTFVGYNRGLPLPPEIDFPREGLTPRQEREFRQWGVDCIIPLPYQRQTIALILLGKKMSEEPFSAADRRLVEPLARTTGFILAHFLIFLEMLEKQSPANTHPLPPLSEVKMAQVSKPLKKVLLQLEKLAYTNKPIFLIGPRGAGHRTFGRYLTSISPRAAEPFIVLDSVEISRRFPDLPRQFKRLTAYLRNNYGVTRYATVMLENLHKLQRSQLGHLAAFLKGDLEVDKGHSDLDLRFLLALKTNYDSGRVILKQAGLAALANNHILELPPLMGRPRDLALVIRLIFRYYANQMNRQDVVLSREALNFLVVRQWRADIDELEDLIKRALEALSALERILQPGHFHRAEFLTDAPVISMPTTFRELQQIKNQMIQRAIEICGGRKVAVARLLGISRQTLYKYLPELE